MRKKTATPSGLAEQLGMAKTKYDDRVTRAVKDLASVRNEVIAEGTNQIDNIVALRAELEIEQAELESVVATAKVS